jgi:hemerythrin-like domain-containing protein
VSAVLAPTLDEPPTAATKSVRPAAAVTYVTDAPGGAGYAFLETRKGAMRTKKISSQKKFNGCLAALEEEHRESFRETEKLSDVLTNMRYEGKLSFGKNLKEANRLRIFFNRVMNHHAEMEEKILFPFLERHVPKMETVIRLLRSEHSDFEKTLKEFNALLRAMAGEKDSVKRSLLMEKLQEIGTYLIYLLRHHLHNENESVYKTISRDLNQNEKEILVRKIRSGQGGKK